MTVLTKNNGYNNKNIVKKPMLQNEDYVRHFAQKLSAIFLGLLIHLIHTSGHLWKQIVKVLSEPMQIGVGDWLIGLLQKKVGDQLSS